MSEKLKPCPISPLTLMAAALRIEDPDNELLTGTAEEHAANLIAKAKKLEAWNQRAPAEGDEIKVALRRDWFGEWLKDPTLRREMGFERADGILLGHPRCAFVGATLILTGDTQSKGEET